MMLLGYFHVDQYGKMVLHRAANAAVADFKPFFNLFATFVDC